MDLYGPMDVKFELMNSRLFVGPLVGKEEL